MATVEKTTTDRLARQALTWSHNMVDPALRAAVDTLPTSMQRIAGYHFGWWDEHGRPHGADGGKAIRSTLALLAAQAVGGAPAAAVPAAVAVELIHNHSLLHDDVIDVDTKRRHRPTAWSVFGSGAAILAGDALLALAFDVLAASGHAAARDGIRMLSAALLDLLDGQSADLAFEGRAEVELAECVSMAEKKTGALMGCACAVGASFGGSSPEQVKHFRSFGERLGLAFQHIDDLLGIWGDPSVTGKLVYSDLQNRKKSLPVVAALTSGTPAGRELATIYHHERPLSDADLVRAARLIDVAGGRTWSQAQADALVTRALRHLHLGGSTTQAASELSALARLVTHRDH